MKREKIQRKLPFNKSTVKNLVALEKFEQEVVKAGSGNTSPLGAGITNHPKYC